jgi:hypothetical protein
MRTVRSLRVAVGVVMGMTVTPTMERVELPAAHEGSGGIAAQPVSPASPNSNDSKSLSIDPLRAI